MYLRLDVSPTLHKSFKPKSTNESILLRFTFCNLVNPSKTIDDNVVKELLSIKLLQLLNTSNISFPVTSLILTIAGQFSISTVAKSLAISEPSLL